MDRRVKRYWKLWALTVALVAAVLPGWTMAASADAEPRTYLRKSGPTNGVMALEVALRSFQPVGEGGPVVWLVGVTHLGDAGYYKGLQEFLDRQTLVLFEGVGATNRKFQFEKDDSYSLQAELAKALGLRFQLEAIEYDRPNFENCDLTVEGMIQVIDPDAVVGEGGGAGGSEFDMLFQLMQGQGFLGTMARWAVGFLAVSPRMQASMKAMMIETFDALPSDLGKLPGLPPGMERLMRILIDERNKVVVEGIGKALTREPRPGSVAVFYGAGHMGDLEIRIRQKWGCAPREERWLKAFTVDLAGAGIAEAELSWIRQMLRLQLGVANQGAAAKSQAEPAK